MPAISTGVFGYPIRRAASIMAEVLKKYSYRSLRKILVVLYTGETYKEFESVFDEVLGKRSP